MCGAGEAFVAWEKVPVSPSRVPRKHKVHVLRRVTPQGRNTEVTLNLRDTTDGDAERRVGWLAPKIRPVSADRYERARLHNAESSHATRLSKELKDVMKQLQLPALDDEDEVRQERDRACVLATRELERLEADKERERQVFERGATSTRTTGEGARGRESGAPRRGATSTRTTGEGTFPLDSDPPSRWV